MPHHHQVLTLLPYHRLLVLLRTDRGYQVQRLCYTMPHHHQVLTLLPYHRLLVLLRDDRGYQVQLLGYTMH
jgi:hypothetical protein